MGIVLEPKGTKPLGLPWITSQILSERVGHNRIQQVTKKYVS